MARVEGPAELAPEQIHRQGLAGVGGGGQHCGGIQRGGECAGQRVGAAQVAGEHRNHEAPGLVDDDHAGVGLFLAQVGGEQPDHRAERHDGDDAVEVGEQDGDLLGGLAGVAGGGAGGGGFGLGSEFLGGEQPGAG